MVNLLSFRTNNGVEGLNSELWIYSGLYHRQWYSPLNVLYHSVFTKISILWKSKQIFSGLSSKIGRPVIYPKLFSELEGKKKKLAFIIIYLKVTFLAYPDRPIVIWACLFQLKRLMKSSASNKSPYYRNQFSSLWIFFKLNWQCVNEL